MILFLTDASPDYGADYLYDGFMEMFGVEGVCDYPGKGSLHGMLAGFDCDLHWARLADYDDADYVPDMLASGRVELLVMPSLRPGACQTIKEWRHAGLLDKVRNVTVCYDAEDHRQNCNHHFVEALGYEPAAYFKRELPIGATWARPLPFGYPAQRIVEAARTKRTGFIYTAYIWEWACGGLREKIAERLDDAVYGGAGISGAVRYAYKPSHRMSVAENHARNQRALVAISPAGQGWGTNRHLEIIADGCAPILQKPTVEFPDAFHGGTECLYFETADEAVSHVRELLGDPAYATGMAQAAQRRWLQHHTTRARAETVWGAVHGK